MICSYLTCILIFFFEHNVWLALKNTSNLRNVCLHLPLGNQIMSDFVSSLCIIWVSHYWPLHKVCLASLGFESILSSGPHSFLLILIEPSRCLQHFSTFWFTLTMLALCMCSTGTDCTSVMLISYYTISQNSYRTEVWWLWRTTAVLWSHCIV